MSVYVDTSALYAAIDADDTNHHAARSTWVELLEGYTPLVCSSYVLLETCALIQRRLGIGAVRSFHTAVYPMLQVEWVDQRLHETAVTAVVTANRRDLSLVDCVSFEVMRILGIDTAFSFDSHFGEQGFRCLPHARLHERHAE